MQMIPFTSFGQVPYPTGQYLREAMFYINEVFPVLESLIYESNYNQDQINIWCRGSSGSILSALLTTKLEAIYKLKNIQIVHVKKPGEDSHSCGNSMFQHALNIIIDDFAVTGNTINAIHKQMKNNRIENVDILILDRIPVTWKFDFKPSYLITDQDSISDLQQ